MYKYQHGGNALFESNGKKILDLSANINPLGFPQGVDEAIIKSIADITDYPDSLSKDLRDEISAFEGIPTDWIYCGNGASDVIFRLSLCIDARDALIPAPTFSDYERSLMNSSTKIHYHYLKEEKGYLLEEDFLDSISENSADIAFICNPNNPTGVLTDFSVIKSALELCKEKGTTLVIDECFLRFVENAEDYSVNSLLADYDNLVIIKAFTKIFALPGIRLGYALCSNESLIEKLYECGPDWPVSNLAQDAGIAAIRGAMNSDYINRTILFIEKERKYIESELKKLNYILFESKANYVFFKDPLGIDLFEKLNEMQIRIRNCDDYVGLSNGCFRVAVSTEENNRRFIKAMKEIAQD